MSSKKPSIAVVKFASCDGCQLSLLEAEDELLAVVGAVDIAYFPEASREMRNGPYDITFVEGSITTHHDAERIQQVRRQSKMLVTIGACATSGGIQALRNWKDVNEFVRLVYASPQFISTLKLSTPIAEHVEVDFELRGCPINKYQLIELIAATLAGNQISRRTPCAWNANAKRTCACPWLMGLHAWDPSRRRAVERCAHLMTAAVMGVSGRWKARTRPR